MNKALGQAIVSLNQSLRSPVEFVTFCARMEVSPSRWEGLIWCPLEDGSALEVGLIRTTVDEWKESLTLGKGWSKGEIDPQELVVFSHLLVSTCDLLRSIILRDLDEFISIVSPVEEVLSMREWERATPPTRWFKRMEDPHDYLALQLNKTGEGYMVEGYILRDNRVHVVKKLPLEDGTTITTVADYLEACHVQKS
jgi:hypothetical protein